MQKIFIVYGRTGEYSDRSEWNVVAYADEEMTKAHAENAERWYLENDCYKQRHKKVFRNPYDPDMHTDYTGTFWSVTSVELRDSLPTEMFQRKKDDGRSDAALIAKYGANARQ